MKWIRVQVTEDLHSMFKRAYGLDAEARSLAHFVQLSMQERASRILGETERERGHGRREAMPESGEDDEH